MLPGIKSKIVWLYVPIVRVYFSLIFYRNFIDHGILVIKPHSIKMKFNFQTIIGTFTTRRLFDVQSDLLLASY